MINRTGVLIFLGLFIGGCLITYRSIQKSDGWFRSSHPGTYMQKEPSFLKIKKLGISKALISQKTLTFYCDIKKSYIPIPITKTNSPIREYLSKISGRMSEAPLNEDLLTFKGEEGILNYHDYSLTITDCFFNIRPNRKNRDSVEKLFSPTEEISSKGGMKILTLSLLKTKK